jgi:hypothetical protein
MLAPLARIGHGPTPVWGTCPPNPLPSLRCPECSPARVPSRNCRPVCSGHSRQLRDTRDTRKIIGLVWRSSRNWRLRACGSFWSPIAGRHTSFMRRVQGLAPGWGVGGAGAPHRPKAILRVSLRMAGSARKVIPARVRRGMMCGPRRLRQGLPAGLGGPARRGHGMRAGGLSAARARVRPGRSRSREERRQGRRDPTRDAGMELPGHVSAAVSGFFSRQRGAGIAPGDRSRAAGQPCRPHFEQALGGYAALRLSGFR